MNRTSLALAASLSLLVTACGQGGEQKAAETPAPKDGMAGMTPPAAAPAEKLVKGTGTVTAVDAAAGTITLDHAPIPEAGWPAMTMGFKAAPSVAEGVKVGDKVAFDLKLQGSAGEITAISKQ